jgi:hypothetical protein
MQVRSDGSSSECGPVVQDAPWWNDQRNDRAWLPQDGQQQPWALKQPPAQVDTTGSVRAVVRASALALVSC